MSNTASDEPVREDHDGVSVEKRFEPDDFPVPAIAFTIRSERDEAVSVRMADTIPDDIPTEDIGFHPKYGAEFWDVEGNTIVFTREFEPNEEFVTVYGLRGKDAADVDRFLTEPELTSIDPIQGASGDVVRDVIADDAEGAEEADADADSPEESGGDGDLDLDIPDPGEAPDDAADDADDADEAGTTAEDSDSTAADDSPAARAVQEDESVAAALAAEIQADEVDEADLEALREALGVTAEDSTEARIEHLQSNVADLEAYTEALEEFLDEEGDAQSVLEDVRADFETASERIDDQESEVEGLRADVSEDLDDELDDIRSDVEAMESDLETVTDERLDQLESDIDSLESELADVAEMRDRLASALGGLGGSSESGGTDDDQSDDADDESDEEELDLGD